MIRAFVLDDLESAGEICIPALGLGSMSPAWFVNHDEAAPNVEAAKCKCYYNCFRTVREIAVGEELFFDYRYFEPDKAHLTFAPINLTAGG